MPHTVINNVSCYYELADFGHAQTIIFSNSLGTNLSMWDEQIPFLSRHVNILRYDTRGHGQSGRGNSPVDILQLGADVVGLLDFLGLDRVVFCGLSMGGLIGQWLGIHAPERFKKIIICNTAAKIGHTEGWHQRIETVTKNGLESIVTATAERWFTSWFRTNQPKAVTDILTQFCQTNRQGYTDCCAAVRDADFRQQLGQLKVPTLIISGEQDPVTTTEDARFLAEQIPVAKHVSLNAAHLSNVERAEEFSAAITDFIS